jgi:hypothetical protein
MTPSGPQWLKNIINEDVLDAWWAGLDYESKWAVACFLAHELRGGPEPSDEARRLLVEVSIPDQLGR